MGLHLPVENPQLILQQVELLLLPKHRAIQFLKQVFGQARLDFQFGQSLFHGLVFQARRPVLRIQSFACFVPQEPNDYNSKVIEIRIVKCRS